MTLDDTVLLILVHLSLLGVFAIAWGVPALWRRQVRGVLAERKRETGEWIDRYAPLLAQLGLTLQGMWKTPCGCSEETAPKAEAAPKATLSEVDQSSGWSALLALAEGLLSRLAPGDKISEVEYEALAVIAQGLVVPVDGGLMPSISKLQQLQRDLSTGPRPGAGGGEG